MSNCNGHCEGCESQCDHAIQKEEQNAYSNAKHVYAVIGGKGGVGKSLVTGMLGALLARKGYKVGIMDADLTGPSIPQMFGIHCLATGDEEGINPVETASGIKLMSINLLLEDANSPVVWRGPVISGVVKQFWSEVKWGELDVLLIDMPPGTGDVPLTVFQSLPIEGLVVVATPQELVSMIVKKAYNMAEMMSVPVLGLIENMSYVVCPDCGKHIDVFGKGGTAQLATEKHLPLLAQLPIDPRLAELCDKGEIERVNVDYLDSAVEELAGKYIK